MRLALFTSPLTMAAVIAIRTLGIGATLAAGMLIALSAFLTWCLVAPAMLWSYGTAVWRGAAYRARKHRVSGEIEFWVMEIDQWLPAPEFGFVFEED